MKREERHSKYMSVEDREKINNKIRARFEKEAHDRERKDIEEVVEVYNKFVSNNALKQLMQYG